MIMIIIDFLCACLLFFVLMVIEIFLRWLLMKLIKPTKVNEYQETKIDKIIERVFVISMFLMVLLALVLGFATKSKAATSVNGDFPYNVADWRSSFTYFSDEQLQYIIDYIDNQNVNDWDYLCFMTDITASSVSSSTVIYVMYNPYIDYAISPSDNYMTNNYQIKTNHYWGLLYYRYDGSTYSIYNTGGANYGTASLFGSPQSVNTAFGSYIPRYPFIYNGHGDPILDTNGKPFLFSRVDTSPGSVTDTSLVDTSDFPDEPDPDDYLPNTPKPTIDRTSLETLVESIFNWLSWQWDQLKGLLRYLTDKIGWLMGKIVDGINKLLQNFIDNLKSLFKPLLDSINGLLDNIRSFLESIKEKIDYITESVDSTAINTAFESTGLYGVYSDFSTFFTTFDSVFDISEPDDWTIIIHLSQLSYFDLPDYVLHLGDNIKPFRNALRLFLWVLVSFGSIIVVEKNLPTWLMGSDSGGGGTKSD